MTIYILSLDITCLFVFCLAEPIGVDAFGVSATVVNATWQRPVEFESTLQSYVYVNKRI